MLTDLIHRQCIDVGTQCNDPVAVAFCTSFNDPHTAGLERPLCRNPQLLQLADNVIGRFVLFEADFRVAVQMAPRRNHPVVVSLSFATKIIEGYRHITFGAFVWVLWCALTAWSQVLCVGCLLCIGFCGLACAVCWVPWFGVCCVFEVLAAFWVCG